MKLRWAVDTQEVAWLLVKRHATLVAAVAWELFETKRHSLIQRWKLEVAPRGHVTYCLNRKWSVALGEVIRSHHITDV